MGSKRGSAPARPRGARLDPELRNLIVRLIEERNGKDPGGHWNGDIARAVGVSVNTVRKFRLDYVDTTTVARARLRATADAAVDHFLEAEAVAATQGNHKPARDHLIAAGVIAGDAAAAGGGGVKIFIGVGVKSIAPEAAPLTLPLKHEKDWTGADHMEAVRVMAAEADDV